MFIGIILLNKCQFFYSYAFKPSLSRFLFELFFDVFIMSNGVSYNMDQCADEYLSCKHGKNE